MKDSKYKIKSLPMRSPWPIAFVALLILTLFLGGMYFYQFQEKHIRRRIEEELQGIAKLKAAQITAWRKDLLADAVYLQMNPFLSTSILNFLADGSKTNKQDLQARFRGLADQHGYADILLVAPNGTPLFSLVESSEKHRGYLPALAEALQGRKPTFSKMHIERPGTSAHISVIVPLFGEIGLEAEPFAALVLIENASRFLYPLVQFWPTPSKTAETLLVKREGDGVLFLNNLRHQSDTALRLRIPISHTDVPAVMAVLGRKGVFQGKDYRNVEVVSVILPIPDSSWFMVAKIDTAEAFSAWRFQAILILVILLGLIVCLVTTGLLFWQHDKKKRYRALYLSEIALRKTVERHSITLKAIGDAVIATDAQSNVELLNPVAEALTGWTDSEARGQPLEEVFRIVNEKTGVKVEDPVARVLREGHIVGLANHTLLVSRDGTRRPIADSGAPISDETGKITGVVLVFRDQTRERAAADRLAERERYYRNLLADLHEDILVIDRDYRITDINNTALQTLGLQSGEVIGRKCYAVSHGLDSPCSKHGESCMLDEVFSTGKPCCTRHDHVSSHGTRKTIDLLMSPHKNKDGQVIRVIEAARDITDVIEMRDALRHSEEKFQAIFENMALGCCVDEIVYINGEAVDYRITDVNPNYERLTGISRNRAVGALASELYNTEQAPNIEIYAKVDATGEPATFDVFFDPTGKHLQITASRIAPGRFCTLLSDTTERKRGEQERERLLAAIEQAGEMVIITDPGGKIAYVNPAFEKASEYSYSEVVGRNARILKSGKQNAAFYRNMKATINSGRTWHGRLINRRKDGTFYTVNATISPVSDGSGQIRNFVAINRDITEYLKLEAQFHQAQKMEAVGRLAGGVAHDYNNMLGVIIGFAEIAMEKAVSDDSLIADLKEILGAAKRSTDITHQLLAFARKQTIAPKVLNLNKAVENILKMLHRLIGEDINLSWKPGFELWPVKIDPTQLDQILANLCVNARDAIADVGKIIIETENICFDQDYCYDHAGFKPGKYVLLAISDDGLGMNKETLSKIFEPFFTTKDTGEGTGLGLAMIYGIVKQNQGFINVYSEPRKGTTFRIYFPRYAETVKRIEKYDPEKIPFGSGETVLVVEDEGAILKLTQRVLKRLGYKVLGASTPNKAITLVKEYTGEIHLLITDVVMPEMNGKDLAQNLRTENPKLKVLFMSGYTANAIAHHGILDTGLHFMQKPFSNKDLAIKVRQAITS